MDVRAENTLRFEVDQSVTAVGTVDYTAIAIDGTHGGAKRFQVAAGASIIDLPLYDGLWTDIWGIPVTLDWQIIRGVSLEIRSPENQAVEFNTSFSTVSFVSVPTPGSILLMSLGLVGVGAVKRRKRA